MHPIFLGVNVDHAATLRAQRKTTYPDPVTLASYSEIAGADSITVHLREDRRHIQEYDVERLQEMLTVPLNLEMAATTAMIDFAIQTKPEYCCLVPEKREELTTEGGLDVITHFKDLHKACYQLTEAGILVSLFIDPDFVQIDAAVRCGAPVIELHTGHYCEASTHQHQQQAYERIQTAVAYAKDKGLKVNAGHGLHYHNVQPIAAIQGLHELNIGHAIIARALYTGIGEAVKEMKRLMVEARKLL